MVTLALAALLLLGPAPLPQEPSADAPHVVFVTGDEEYRSEESMPMIASLLEKEYGIRCTVLYALNEHGEIAPNHLNNIPGLEVLAEADLLVQFTRFRALPEEQLQHLLDYIESGKPIAGFRTTTHALLYPEGHPNAKWNDAYGQDFFGQRWITHHGHRSTTAVTPRKEMQGQHPVLNGVKAFPAASWLYHVEGGGDQLPADAIVLAWGDAVDSGHGEARAERFPLRQPVAWVRDHHGGGRVFFTTLGHPYDFKQESMRTLTLNGILWALGMEKEIPSWGCEVMVYPPFEPTDAKYGGAIPGMKPEGLSARWEPRKDARVALVGNTMAERMSFFGNFETMLHATWPFKNVHVRNLGWSADTPSFQPRPANFGSMEEHLAALQADTVFGFFGFNESFAGEAGLEDFRAELDDWIRRVRSRRLADGSLPEVILVSPFMPEQLGGRFPDNRELAKQMQPYVDAMASVARRAQVRFLDLFSSDAMFLDGAVTPEWERRTINGIHLTEGGDFAVATEMMLLLTGDAPFPDERYFALREAVVEKAQQWWYRHRAVNGYYIYGGRKDPFGSVSFPGEMHNFDLLVAAHDQRIHALAVADEPGEVAPLNLDALPTLPEIPTNFEQDITILSPAEAEAAMTVAEGYRATVFASEVDFPELQNPVSLTFDGKGRLWVSTMPTYPQVSPGEEPHCRILILEDTDGDDRADKRTVFAEGLHLPGGFELGDGGAYVAEQPNIVFLRDTDGDDVADEKTIVLEGFGTEDSHHSISAFTWGPGGGLYFQEGTFHHSQVETPHGPVRVKDGAVFRWEPHTGRMRVHVPFGFWNPWGHVFDDFGQDYVGDASDGNNYLAAPMTTDKEYERYRRGLESFTVARVRPTGGSEIIGSETWPAEVRGDYMITNTIGFQGIRAHRLRTDGSGVWAEEHWDLLTSSDRNFRPIDLQFGPDGSLYFVDWFNPLIGHMQHSLRDPNRDHSHGRIWKVVRMDAPRREVEDLTILSPLALMRELTTPDSRHRYRVRRELRNFSAEEIRAAMQELEVVGEHHLLEIGWVHQQAGILQPVHVERLLQSEDARIRAAAVRMMNMEVHNPLYEGIRSGVLLVASMDQAPMVRLEAVSLATRWPSLSSFEAVLRVMEQPTDRWLDYAIEQAILFLKPQWVEGLRGAWSYLDSEPELARSLLAQLDAETLLSLRRSPAVARAILLRAEVSAAERADALKHLATEDDTAGDAAVVQEWIAALQKADALPSGHRSGLGDLVAVFEPAGFRPHAEALHAMALFAQREDVRRAAMAGWMKGLDTATSPPLATSAPPNALWKTVVEHPHALRDALAAARMIGSHGIEARTGFLGMLITAPHAWPGFPTDTGTSEARYVRIDLPGTEPLTLAEVEVWSGGRNVARNGTATQMDEAWGGHASRALDGNTSGAWGDGAQTHTSEGGTDPWWEVDLGAAMPIESITLWNRTDGNLGRRLEGYRLSLLDAERRVVWSVEDQPAPARQAAHAMQVDWKGVVFRGAIRAMQAGDRLPMDPTLGRTLAERLEAIPLNDRGQDWFLDGLALLHRLSQGERAEAMRMTVIDLTLDAQGSPSLEELVMPAGRPVELRIHNESTRWAAFAILSEDQAARLAAAEHASRVAIDPVLQRGLETYQKHCLSCHAPDGGGLVGPNMTDDFYLHLQSSEEMPALIRDGLLERGMTPFKDILNDGEIAAVTAYMISLRGTTAAQPKEAQGALAPPFETPQQRLGRLRIDAGFLTEAVAPGQSRSFHFPAPPEPSAYTLDGILPGGSRIHLPIR